MEEFINNILSNGTLMNVIGSIIFIAIHIILTFAVYKWKGGPIACFYFFLAPVAIAVIIIGFFFSVAASGNSSSNRHDHYHHF